MPDPHNRTHCSIKESWACKRLESVPNTMFQWCGRGGWSQVHGCTVDQVAAYFPLVEFYLHLPPYSHSLPKFWILKLNHVGILGKSWPLGKLIAPGTWMDDRCIFGKLQHYISSILASTPRSISPSCLSLGE